MARLLTAYLVLQCFAGLIALCMGCDKFKYRESVILECRLPGTKQLTNCYAGGLPQGTVASYKCAANYIPANYEVKTGQVTCGKRDRWTGHDRFEYFACSIDCGRSTYEPDELLPLVVGGVETHRSEWPWHVSIFGRPTSSAPFQYICGGTLVKPYSRGFVIVTAAHCLADGRSRARDPSNVKILLGANFSTWDDNNRVPNAQRHRVRQIIIHDSYEASTLQADIAVLSVKDPIKMSSNVLPACFSGGDDLAELNSQGTVVGFGAYEYANPTVSKVLRKVKLPIVPKDRCYEWRQRKLLPQEICAGYANLETTPSACNGDSGGGFVFPKSFRSVERFYLEGIVSHGRKNLENRKEECDFYSVFTKVSSYEDWIREKAEELALAQEEAEDAPPFTEEPKFVVTTTQRSARPRTTTKTQNVPERSTVRPRQPTQQTTQSGNTGNNNDFKSIGLARHNYYRSRHGSGNLRLSERLNRNAQAYAEKLLRQGSLSNEYEDGINKNVYRSSGHLNIAPSVVVQSAVDSWYAAKKSYNWNNPSYSTFSQVVWRSTTEMGVGYASQGGAHFVVVSYSPPGNLDGENGRHYKENVFPERLTD